VFINLNPPLKILCFSPVFPALVLSTSVVDPDPYVFGQPDP